MAARSTWSGAIQFGMVAVPVKLFAAVSEGTVRFHNLHKVCGSPVKMPRTCPTCSVTLEAGDLVKAYEVGKDTYVRLEEQELASLPVRAIKAIEVLRFCEAPDLDARFYEAPYFVGFDPKVGGKAFALLKAGMEQTGLIALARIVMREKEHIALLRPLESGFMLWTLRWADELRDAEEALTNTVSDVSEQETALAVRLIEAMKGPLALQEFHDSYHEAVLNLVERKLAGEIIEIAKAEEQAPVGDVVSALLASLEATRQIIAAPEPAPALVAAPSAKTKKTRVA